VWCLLASLLTSLLYFNSKIEKDDKSPGEESDISDDDTGLLLLCLFIIYVFILNVL